VPNWEASSRMAQPALHVKEGAIESEAETGRDIPVRPTSKAHACFRKTAPVNGVVPPMSIQPPSASMPRTYWLACQL